MSVVIPALNEERHVGSLLSDVLGQTRRQTRFKIAMTKPEGGRSR